MVKSLPGKMTKIWLLITIYFLASMSSIKAAEVVVAAAADLRAPLQEVADQFTKEKGTAVKLEFKPAGDFYHEILKGKAPYEVFMSADEAFPVALDEKGLTQGQGVRFALGRVGLLIPKDSTIKSDPELKDFKTAAGDGRVKKFVIADPHHAPYGVAAQEVLQHLAVWKSIKPKLVMAKSSTKVVDVVAEKSAQGGIIPMSVKNSPTVASLGSIVQIPNSWHKPLNQRMVLMKTASAEAKDFYEYIQQPAAQAILQHHGYEAPDLSSPIRRRHIH